MNRHSFVTQRISTSSSNIPFVSSTTNSFNKDYRSRWFSRLPRSNSSSMMRFNADQQRQELDLLLKQLSNGKVFHTISDDQTSSEISETIVSDEDDRAEDDDDDDDQPATPKQSDVGGFFRASKNNQTFVS